MISPTDFRKEIVQPTLKSIAMHSDAAENLLVGTAVQESRLTFLRQIGGGPALGVYQIEPATRQDIYVNWLKYRPDVRDRVNRLAASGAMFDDQLVFNLAYATAIARLVYYRQPDPLPAADDIDGLAGYWKQHFNTPLGKGTAAEFAENYRRFCR